MGSSDGLYNLLSLFGLDAAPDEDREKFLAEASEKVLEAVVARIEEKLPPEKREEFYRLFEQEPPTSAEEKTAFFRENIPEFADLVLAEVERFRREGLAAAEQES